MATDELPRLPADWERELTAQVVSPMEAGRAASIAAAASAAVRKTRRSAVSRGIALELLLEGQEIAPGETLLGRLAQEVGRVQRREQRDAALAG